MKIAFISLGDRPLTLAATETPQEVGLESSKEAAFDAPVEVSATLTRMQEDALAEGKASTRARVPCSRCLEDVVLELRGEFRALYVPQSGVAVRRDARYGLDEGDQRVNFYAEQTIDLSEEICNCLLLELPMKPLCKPDCAGLCHKCGENLNEGPCGCPPDAEEDPWAKLRDLIPPPEKQ